MAFRWFLSRTVREAMDLSNRIHKAMRAQQDLLTTGALNAIGQSNAELQRAIASGNDTNVLERANGLESVAKECLKPYPNASLRENVEVMLVALVLAVSIRTFFLQPMAIPTGSMQPTLSGVTHVDLRNDPGFVMPPFWKRIVNSLTRGIQYYQLTAVEDGIFERFEPRETLFPCITRQRLVVSKRPYSVWFPPEDLPEKSGLLSGNPVRKGKDIIRLKVISGDRLFVDRFTYNFRPPERGEVIVFLTEGIGDKGLDGVQQDTHYIKRLVGMPGETLVIGNDRHVIVDGRRLDASTPHFENIYSFSGPPADSLYSGHLNIKGLRESGDSFAIKLKQPYVLPQNKYFVLGDNTVNSYDSRYWGFVPRENVVGRQWFVFWPISPRFGWSVR